MITISMDPIIFNIGHFALRWYSLILLIAIGVGIWLTAREAERKGFEKDDVYDAALWIVLGGLIGARLFHVLDHWSHEYAANPMRALYIWEGGLAIWGAVAGGILALVIFARRRGLSLGRLADIAAPRLALAMGVGR